MTPEQELAFYSLCEQVRELSDLVAYQSVLIASLTWGRHGTNASTPNSIKAVRANAEKVTNP
jgi:hypothetical protein